LDSVKFPLVKGNVASSTRRVKRKWQSQEEQKVDRDYDAVVVPSDGGCFSGSEYDDSDWTIGWLEPLGPGFLVIMKLTIVLRCWFHAMEVVLSVWWRMLRTRF